MEKEKKEIKISLFSFYVLMAGIVFLIGAVLLGWMAVGNRNIQEEAGNVVNNQLEQNVVIQGNQQTENNEKVEQLDVESALVKKLYNYIGVTGVYQQTSMYRFNKSTEKTLDNKTKLLTAFNELDESDIAYVYNAGPNENIVTTDEMFGGEEVWELEGREITVIKAETIENKVKEIFGKDATIYHEDCSPWYTRKVAYVNGEYKCFDYEGGGGDGVSGGYSEIIKAEKQGNEIFIYDNYISVLLRWTQYGDGDRTDGYDIFAVSDNQFKIAQISEDDLLSIEWLEQGLGITVPQYKHTFRKAETGEYYWVSTEMINKNEIEQIPMD